MVLRTTISSVMLRAGLPVGTGLALVAPICVGVLLSTSACKKSNKGLATLVSAAGPVEKTGANSEWKSAAIGTAFSLGDAARTGDGNAAFKLSGGAELAMAPHTVLRFGGASKDFSVELGVVELRGTGAFNLEMGRIEMGKGGGVRITRSGVTGTQFDLLMGDVSVLRDGKAVALETGKPFMLELGDIQVQVKPVDAPVVVDAAIADAGMAFVMGEISIAITGNKAELMLPGSKTWTPVAAGTSALPAGATLRLGGGTTAKLVRAGTTLDLSTGSRVAASEQFDLTMQSGMAIASVEQGTNGTVRLPGGLTVLQGEKGPASTRIDVDSRESKVAVTRGTLELTSQDGTKLPLARGESAALSKAGAIRVIDAIPSYFDLEIAVGASLQIHDPKGATAVRFNFGDRCSGGNGDVELDRDNRFKTPRISSGQGSANHMIAGGWTYRLRCNGKVAASGRISVVRDSGERRLAPTVPTNPVETDGRKYSITYQSQLPNILVKWKGAIGSNFTLFVATGGKSQKFTSATPQVTVPGKALKEGQFTYWFEREDGLKSKVSTLLMDFDQQAAQVYIEAPQNGKPFATPLEVRGAALAGWTASTTEGVALKLDKQRRFAAQLSTPKGNAFAIRFVHPQLGEHLYVRRSK